MANKSRERLAKPRKVLEAVSAQGDSKFARALGSVDGNTREQGLQALSLWLSRKQNVERLDLLKLWKGIFYTFWHSDKSPVQSALAERLADLLVVLPPAVADLYYKTFVQTMRREWFGIDRLRMDKFMMLVRKFLFAHLRRLRQDHWDVETVQQTTGFWLEEVLLPSDTLAATGFAYHLTDLLIPELQRVVTCPAEQPSTEALAALLEPFCQALALTENPALMQRVRHGVFMAARKEIEAPSEQQPLRHLAMQALAERIFDLGSKEETKIRNREACYILSRVLENTRPGVPAAPARPRKEAAGEAAAAAATAGPAPSVTTPELPAPANGLSAQKKKKAKRAEPETNGSDPAAACLPQPGPPSSKKKRSSSSEGTQPSPAAAASASPAQKSNGFLAGPPAAAAAWPASSTPSATPTPPRTAAGSGPAPALPSAAKPPSTGKARKKAAQVAASTPPPSLPAAVGPGGAAGAGTPAATPDTQAKKNVRFSLKRNLVMTIGEPPAPSEVRTPPSSKPKGSALKKASTVGGAMARHGDGAVRRLSLQGAGSGAAARSGTGRGRSSLGPRPKAADFF